VVVGADDDLQHQLDAHGAGWVFELEPGIYRLTQPLHLKDRQQLIGRGHVVLSGARTLTFARDGAVWVSTNQMQEGAVVERTSEVCTPAAPRCNRPEDLFVDDQVLTHVATRSDVGPGRWFFDYPANQIVIGDNPDGHVVETSVTPFAIIGNADHVTLRNLIIEKFATPSHEAAVNGRMTYLTVDNLEARFNHFAGIRTIDGSVAQHTRVHHNGALGFIGSGPDIRIEQNEIDHNNTVGYNPFWAAGGTKWVYTTRLVVRNNDAHDNRGPGLWTDINNEDVLVEDNRVFDNDLSGIFHEVGYRAIIRRNTVHGNGRTKPFPGWVVGAGILVSSSSDVEVYDNVVTDNWQGIAGLEDDRGMGAKGPWLLARLYVHDNIVRQSAAPERGSGRTGIAQVHEGVSSFRAGLNRFEHNSYTLTGGTGSFMWMGRDVSDAEWRHFHHDVTGAIVRH